MQSAFGYSYKKKISLDPGEHEYTYQYTQKKKKRIEVLVHLFGTMNTCRDRSFDLDELEDVDVLDEDVEVELLELGTEVTGVTVSQNPVLNLQEASGATISRKRSMQRTSSEKEDISAKAKRSRYSQGSSTNVNVSPHRRVKEFPDEMLDVSAGKLFCDACHTVLGLKKSIISDHLSSERHKEGKERREQQELRQQRIMQSWEHYQQRPSGNLAGTGLTGTVPPDQAFRRIQTATAMLKAGIPLAKVDYLRPLLEAGASAPNFDWGGGSHRSHTDNIWAITSKNAP